MHSFNSSHPLKILALSCLLFFHQYAFANSQVSTDWLAQHISDTNLVLVDMTDDPQYQRFHLPGAVHLPYQAINTLDRFGASFSSGPDHISMILGLLGINADSRIIIYDDLGGLNAGRLFWELEGLGHQNVALLDGGLVTWILEGRKVSNKAVQPDKTTYVSTSKKPRTNLATLADITRLPPDAVLLDVRTREEYAGDPRQSRSGHIPGAKWWPWDATVDFNDGFRLRSAAELQRQLQALDLSNPATPIFLYCRTGHRASQSYYVLRQLGFKNVKLYDGSIAEYSRHSELPLKTGMQP